MSEKIFQLSSTQFGTRISPEELAYINENMIDLLPDDGSEVTNRSWLMNLVNKTMSKVQAKKARNQADIEKIQELEAEAKRLFEMQDQNRIIISKYEAEIKELNESIERLANAETGYNELANELQHKDEQIQQLAQKIVPDNAIVMQLTQLESAVVELVRERLEKRANKPVSKKDVIFSTFWMYQIKQEWEFSGMPFLVSKRELQQLAKQIPANNEF